MKNVTKDPVQGRLGKVYMPDQQVRAEFCFWKTISKISFGIIQKKSFDMIT
jgi:hypothetical protein